VLCWTSKGNFGLLYLPALAMPVVNKGIAMVVLALNLKTFKGLLETNLSVSYKRLRYFSPAGIAFQNKITLIRYYKGANLGNFYINLANRIDEHTESIRQRTSATGCP
jgi:hypothetical protein